MNTPTASLVLASSGIADHPALHAAALAILLAIVLVAVLVRRRRHRDRQPAHDHNIETHGPAEPQAHE